MINRITTRSVASLAIALAVSCSSSPDTPLLQSTAHGVAGGVPPVYMPIYTEGYFLQRVESFRKSLPYDTIMMERTGCYGTCPVYTMMLHRSGKAELNVVFGLPNLGRFLGEVDLMDYGRLCYLLDHSGFGEFRESYAANWTDDSTCIVTTIAGAMQKRVSDYGSIGPIDLWSIQQVIDGMRERITWTPVPEPATATRDE